MAASAASITAVQKAYVAYYGRPADPTGLTYWSERLDSIEGEFTNMIEDFGSSDEATALFGSLENDEKINTIYQQIFGRDADAEGLAFYSDALTAGTMSAATIAQNIIDGAQDADLTIVTNKLTLATSFTDYVVSSESENYSGNDAITAARDWLGAVDATDTSVTSASASLSSVVDALEPEEVEEENPGQTFRLTMGEDDLVGTSGDDTFTGTSAQVSDDDDKVSGGEGTDTLTLAVRAAVTVMSLDSIEVVNLNLESFDNLAVDVSEVDSGTTINLATSTGYSTTMTVSASEDLTINTGNLKTVTLANYDEGIIGVGSTLTSLKLDAANSTEATINLSNSATLAITETDVLDDLVITAVGGARLASLEAAVTQLTGDITLSGGVTLEAGSSAFTAASIVGGSTDAISINTDTAGAIDVEDWNVTIKIDSTSADFTNAVDKTFEITTSTTNLTVTTDDDGGAFTVLVNSGSADISKGASAETMNVVIGSSQVSVNSINATSGDTVVSFSGAGALVISSISGADLSSLVYLDHDGSDRLTVSTSTALDLDASESSGLLSITGNNIATNIIRLGSNADYFTFGSAATAASTSVFGNDGNDAFFMTTMYSGAANLSVYLNGGAGNDVFSFGSATSAAGFSSKGNLSILGGDGTDTLAFGYTGSGTVDLLSRIGVDSFSSVTINGIETITALSDLHLMASHLSSATLSVSAGTSSGDALRIVNATSGAVVDLSNVTLTGWDSITVDLSLSVTTTSTSKFVGTLSGVAETVNGIDHDTGRDGFTLNLGSGNDVYHAATAGGTLTLGAGLDTVIISAGYNLSVFDFDQRDEHLIIADFNSLEDTLDFSGNAVAVMAVANAKDVSAYTVEQTSDTVSVYLSGGMVTLVGDGADNVDTLSEYASIATKAASANGVVGFTFDGSTWVLHVSAQTITNIVELDGVIGVNLGLTPGANTIDIAG